MKKVLLLMMMPTLCFGQVKVEVSQKQTFSQSYNDAIKAGAASRAASAEAEKARAAKAAAMSDIGAEILVDLTVDLNNYTHIALVSVVYASENGTKVSGQAEYKNFGNLFINSPLTLINPYEYDKKIFKKNKRFLKDIKNPSWLYVYYEKSMVGVDAHRIFVVKNYNNKIIYRGKYINTPKADVVSPFVYFDNSFNETDEEISYDSEKKQEAEAKAKTEYEAKVKQEAEAKAKAEYEAKVKQEAEAKAKTEYEAKVKQEAEAKAKANNEMKSEPATKPSKEIKADSVQLLDITLNNMKIFDYGTLEVGDQVIFKFVGTNRGIIKRVSGDGEGYYIGNREYYPWGTTDIDYSELYFKNKKILGYKKSN
jgi:hypothetical protein